MKSYEQIAEETGASVEDVREAMACAKKREVPYCRVVEDYDNPPTVFPQVCYAREEVAFNVFWAVPDEYRPDLNRGTGRTREEAVIDALDNGFR